MFGVGRGAGGFGRRAVAAQVEENEGVVERKEGGEAVPDGEILGGAMEEEEGWARGGGKEGVYCYLGG